MGRKVGNSKAAKKGGLKQKLSEEKIHLLQLNKMLKKQKFLLVKLPTLKRV